MLENLNIYSVYVFFIECYGFKMIIKFNNFCFVLVIFFLVIILFVEEYYEFKCMYEVLVILINKF